MLIRRDVLIDWMLAVQDLAFHADISSVTFQRSTQSDTVIGSRCQLELEAEDKEELIEAGFAKVESATPDGTDLAVAMKKDVAVRNIASKVKELCSIGSTTL